MWVLASIGPDGYSYIPNLYGPTSNIVEIFQNRPSGTVVGINMYYSPTNGTSSQGDLFLSGPSGGYGFTQNTNFGG